MILVRHYQYMRSVSSAGDNAKVSSIINNSNGPRAGSSKYQ
jgi:hypothetical protein